MYNINIQTIPHDEGSKLGRKEGYRKPKEDKAEEYKQVIKYLKQGINIRKTAKLCDVSASTVQRVKAEFNIIKEWQTI